MNCDVMCDAYIMEMLSCAIIFIILHPCINLSKILRFIYRCQFRKTSFLWSPRPDVLTYIDFEAMFIQGLWPMAWMDA